MNISPSCEGSPSVDDGFGGLYRTVRNPVWTCWFAQSIGVNTWTMEELLVESVLLCWTAADIICNKYFFCLGLSHNEQFHRVIFKLLPEFPVIRMVIEDGLVGGCGGCIRHSGVRSSLPAHNLLKVSECVINKLLMSVINVFLFYR